MGRLARIFWAYRTGAATVPQLPVRLWIESTSRCNLKCGYCPNKDVVKEDHGFMDFGLYTSIIDQVKDHAYDVNLFHRGSRSCTRGSPTWSPTPGTRASTPASTPTSRCSTRRRAGP